MVLSGFLILLGICISVYGISIETETIIAQILQSNFILIGVVIFASGCIVYAINKNAKKEAPKETEEKTQIDKKEENQ